MKKEYKFYSFEYGNKNGDVIINCNDGLLKTQSAMLLLCSQYFKDYQEFTLGGNQNEFVLPYNKKIVTFVLQKEGYETIDSDGEFDL